MTDYSYINFSFGDFPVQLTKYTLTEANDHYFDFHYQAEIGIMLDGVLERDYNGKHIECRRNDIWIHGIWEPHGYILKKAPCSALVMILDPIYFSKTDQPFINWLDIFSVPAEEKMKLCGNETLNNVVAGMTGKFLNSANHLDQIKFVELKSLVSQLLLAVGEALGFDWKMKTGFSPKNTNEIQKAVVKVFGTRDYLSVDEIAAECNMNRNKFSKLFQNTMGVSFSTFALRYRLNNAAGALLNTPEPIENIATDWGFTDISHFNKTFFAHYGVTPGKYRLLKT